MLINEEKRNDIDLSIKKIIRLKTNNNIQEIETLPSVMPEIKTNQISILNNLMPEKEITSPFIRNKNPKQFKFANSNNELFSKRIDRNGNEICKNGKQRVTFIDKITNNKLVDFINVENFKKYNKIEEEINFVEHNGCCLIQ